jgi:hypothetical protein
MCYCQKELTFPALNNFSFQKYRGSPTRAYLHTHTGAQSHTQAHPKRDTEKREEKKTELWKEHEVEIVCFFVQYKNEK